jgi:hypothetical protein
MQHNIEDNKLPTLEDAWRQVEETHNATLESSIIEVFNSIVPEYLKVVSSNDDESVNQQDNFEVDEFGNASGKAWDTTEVRKVFEIDGQLPSELKAKLQSFNSDELSNKFDEIYKSQRVPQFAQSVEQVTGVKIEDLYDFYYDTQTGEFGFTVKSIKDEEGGKDVDFDKQYAADVDNTLRSI